MTCLCPERSETIEIVAQQSTAATFLRLRLQVERGVTGSYSLFAESYLMTQKSKVHLVDYANTQGDVALESRATSVREQPFNLTNFHAKTSQKRIKKAEQNTAIGLLQELSLGSSSKGHCRRISRAWKGRCKASSSTMM